MKSKLLLSLAVVLPLIALAGTVFAWPEPDRVVKTKKAETEITFDQAPEAVRAAILHWTSKDQVREIEKVVHGDLVFYDVEYRHEGREADLVLSASGNLIESERAIAPSKLPAEIRAAFAKKHPGAKIVSAEVSNVQVYEFVAVIRDKRQEFEALASGEIEAEDDDEDEHDDDEDDDEDDDDHDDDEDGDDK